MSQHQAPGVRLEETSIWPSSQPWRPPQQYNKVWYTPQEIINDNTAQSKSRYPPNQVSSLAMAGQYNYPPPDGNGNSPSASSGPLPPLSLPPIRSIDNMNQSQQQQQQQQPPQQAPQGQQSAQPPLSAAMPPAMGQYYGQTHPFPPDHNAPQRWPLPPDGRVMSGGRHKKEIKRRTKTGCLTCRKRRIKCDEAHPACRNCQKSKRDCLGYDPIFKPQPGPTAIQPAVSGGAPLSSGSTNSSSYPSLPQGYMHASSQGYGQQGTNSENSTGEPYEYSTAIDPTLEGGSGARMQDTKVTPDGRSRQGSQDQQGHRAKRTRIEELLCLRGYSPPPPAAPTQIPTNTREEIKHIWITVYAPGIDKFLETRWFVMRGLPYLMDNHRLCDQFATLLHRFTMYPYPHPTDPALRDQFYITQSLEATVVWAMMGMCRQVASTPKSENGGSNEVDVKEGVHDAAKRLEILEALITGEYLDSESAPQQAESSNGTALENQLKSRERDFWRLVHTFLTIRDDEASAAKEIDDTLASCRTLLDSRENRDVIYSIMISRHIGARVAEFPNNLHQPDSNDEADNKNKLAVAKDFIEKQCGQGTNQVVQRLCGMAARSWLLKK